MLLSPGLILAIASIIAIVVIEPNASGVSTGLLGAVFGVLLGLAALQAGMLAGALLAGVVVHRVVIGVGPRLVEWGTAARPVVLRAVPLFLSVSVGPGRGPVRLRMWAAALGSA